MVPCTGVSSLICRYSIIMYLHILDIYILWQSCVSLQLFSVPSNDADKSDMHTAYKIYNELTSNALLIHALIYVYHCCCYCLHVRSVERHHVRIGVLERQAGCLYSKTKQMIFLDCFPKWGQQMGESVNKRSKSSHIRVFCNSVL